jgi:hypothetical protein
MIGAGVVDLLLLSTQADIAKDKRGLSEGSVSLGAVVVLMPWAASLRKEEARRSLQGVTGTDPASHQRWEIGVWRRRFLAGGGGD